jgi:hypothetical protein
MPHLFQQVGILHKHRPGAARSFTVLVIINWCTKTGGVYLFVLFLLFHNATSKQKISKIKRARVYRLLKAIPVPLSAKHLLPPAMYQVLGSILHARIQV